MRKSMVIAHRGASKAAPENTMSAFEKAIEMNAGGIELDVQLSKDGYPVVIHDERVNRTSNGTGWVKDKTLEELMKLDFGSWFSGDFKDERIPTLEQVLKLLSGKDMLLNIEIKSGVVLYPGIEKKVIDLIRKYDMADRIIISGFNHYSLVEVKRLDSCIKTGILYMAGLFEPWNYAKSVGAYAIHPLFHSVVPEIVGGCKANGIAVNPFTVDQPEYIKQLALLGVEGIITNVPDVAIDIINGIGVKKDEA